MGDVVGVAAAVAILAAVLTGGAALARRLRRRGLGGAVMGLFDEVWHPSAHDARVEVHEQDERPAPAPAPGEPPAAPAAPD